MPAGEIVRRVDQEYDPPLGAVAPGGRAGILRARKIIIVGAGGELFVYSPTAGAGNLIYSIAAQAGTDPYGNTVLQGATSYVFGDSTGAVGINQSAITLHRAITTPGADSAAVFQWIGTNNTIRLTPFSNVVGMLIGGTPLFADSIMLIPPSGDTTGVTDAANMVAALAITNVIQWTAGTYTVTPGQVVLAPGQYIHGAGKDATTVHAPVGSSAGDIIRAVGTSTSSSAPGGGITDMTIDGTNSAAGSSGLHLGDMFHPLVNEVVAQNFTGAGSIGFWFDNQYTFTEQITGNIWAKGNTQNVVFDNSTGTSLSANATGSFDRACMRIFIVSRGIGDGVTFQNGAFAIDGDISIYGNMSPGATQFGCLVLTGSNAGGFSLIRHCTLNIGVENASTGPGATKPYTINFGSAGNNVIAGCQGVMDFSANATFGGSNNGTNSFQWFGPLFGDTTIWPTRGGDTPFNAGTGLSSGQLIHTVSDVIMIQPTSNLTGMLLQKWVTAMGTNVRVTVINNSSSFTIAFAAAGTSNVITGTDCVIQPNTSMTFWFSSITGKWHPETVSAFLATSQLYGHLSGSDQGGTLTPSVAAGTQSSAASVTGTDLAGTITITANVGAVAGQLAVFSFNTAFTNTPVIVLTPVNLNAASAQVYATSGSGSGFNVNCVNNPASGGSLVFTYAAIGLNG